MTSSVPHTDTQDLPRLVLDTNVVLDWLVFRDAACNALASALRNARVRWIVTAAMREELEQVLARGALEAWKPDLPVLRAHWDRWSTTVPAQPEAPAGSPRCSDPDDQKFIALALHCGAGALLSRDRAVLRCARRARPFGLEILTPMAWALRTGAGPPQAGQRA